MTSGNVRLGVDFGTSNTVAVLRWPDGRARPLLFDGSPLLPSAVYAEPGGALIVGRDAVHSARLEPACYEPNPKRRVDDGQVLLGDRAYSVGEIIAAVLRRVNEECRRTAGDVLVEVTMTCPATWGATRRLVLSDAARAAGFGEVRLVAEPVAAATYFSKVLGRDVPIGSVVVVHDFGAGTFDATVVARTSAGFDVLAVDGRDDIGGLDIDEALVKHIGQYCAARDAQAWTRLDQPKTLDDRRARRLLWDDARIAKERLSRAASADIAVPLIDQDMHITREELEDLARPLIEQTVRVTRGVMRWANLADGRTAGVFLVGGASRIPLVATLLHRGLSEAPVVIEQPELVVAEGSMLASEQMTPNGPVSGGPVSGGPVPGRPVSGGPVPGRPVSGVPVSGGHGFALPASGGPEAVTVPLPRVNPAELRHGPVPGAQMRDMAQIRDAAQVRGAVHADQQRGLVPAARAPHPPENVHQQYRATGRPGGNGRGALNAMVIAMLLTGILLVSAYVAFKVTAGEPLLPLEISSLLQMRSGKA